MLTFPNPFCAHKPHRKQKAFLNLTCLEAFFGGAVGGGKSEALLMAALQYVDVPGYAALILRKDLQRLALPGGLIPRSHEWLSGTPATWNGQLRRWSFPQEKGPPATLTFGYLANAYDKFRYASSELQYLGFDELTEIREEDYLFLFSRLRRIKNIDVKLRVRAASNPGNIGHLWVKQRFLRQWTPGGPLPDGMRHENGIYYFDDRAFIPSLIADNPSLNATEYIASLMHLPPIERERLANGDWSVQENAYFRARWFRYFKLANDQYDLLGPNDQIIASIRPRDCRRFATVDPAGTSADVDQSSRARSRSFSVMQIWDQPRSPDQAHYLICREQYRDQVSIQTFCNKIRSLVSSWKPERVWIEDEKLGHSLKNDLSKIGVPVELIATQNRDKSVRAVTLANKMERGQVFFPKYDEWRFNLESEFLAWTGASREPSDQIDAAAYAAIISQQYSSSPMRIQPIVMRS